MKHDLFLSDLAHASDCRCRRCRAAYRRDLRVTGRYALGGAAAGLLAVAVLALARFWPELAAWTEALHG